MATIPTIYRRARSSDPAALAWVANLPAPLMLLDGQRNIMACSNRCLTFLGLENSLVMVGQPFTAWGHWLGPWSASHAAIVLVEGSRKGTHIPFTISPADEIASKAVWIYFEEPVAPRAFHATAEGIETAYMLEQIVRNFPNGTISILDLDYKIVYIAGQSLVQHGISSSNITGKKLEEMLQPEEFQFVFPFYKRAMAGEEVEFEFVFKQKFHYLFACAPFFDEEGKQTGILVVNRNISDQKEAERRIRDLSINLEQEVRKRTRELEESREEYRALYQESPVMLATVDLSSGKITRSNNCFASTLGYAFQELEGIFVTQLLDPESLSRWQDALDTFRQQGRLPSWEFTFLTRTGTHVITRGALADPSAHDNQLHILWDNLTRQQEIQQELRESEFQFRMLAQSVPLLIWMNNADGLRHFFNQPWVAFSEKPMATLLAGEWMDLIHPDDQPAFIVKVEESRLLHAECEWEYRLRHHSGDYRWMWGKAKPRFNSLGQFIGMIGAEVDIQNRKDAEAKLRHASQALTHSHHELAEMSYFLSQEVKSSLEETHQYLHVLQSAFEQEEGASILLHQLKTKCTATIETIRDVMAFARISRAELQRSWMDVETLFQAALDEVAREKGAARPVFSLQEPGHFFADPSMMRLLAKELIGNSFTFQMQGRPLHLELGTTMAAGREVWYLRDNGRGLEPRTASAIFDVFFSSEPLNRNGSMGIGLAICKAIIERHGGAIWAEGKPNQGTTIYFSMPL